MTNPIQGLPGVGGIQPATELKKPQSSQPADASQFMNTLRSAMGQVERLQADGQQHVSDLLRGNGEDLHKAMIAVEKADLAFELMMEVRNKIVQAYQEISRMPF